MKEKIIETIRAVPIAGKTYEEYVEAVADELAANSIIVPPCKVGDKVYIIDDEGEGSEPYVLGVIVTVIGYDISGFWITMNLPVGLKQSAHVGDRFFGKTVFLTREEAEKALERSKR